MSDRQLRPTTASGISKRPRKASQQKDNDAQQRERKRALDRKAQRASREKTRSHIAHLEKMVQILSDKNGNTATSELLEEMGRLQAEIERLKKIIDAIKSVLGAEMFEATAPAVRRISQSPDQDNSRGRSPRLNKANLCEINSPSADSPIVHAREGNTWNDGGGGGGHGSSNDYAEEDLEEMENDGDEPNAMPDTMPETTVEVQSNVPSTVNLDWMDSIDEESVAVSRWDGMRKAPQHTAFWNLPTPTRTFMPMPAVPNFVPCKIWMKANTIYAKIFEYDRQRVYEADQVDAGSLVKVVKDGWGSLSFHEANNPVLQILKEVDQYLFWDLDPVTKIANLYKSLLLLKYYFNAETRNLEHMPDWQRPVHSQKVRRHPIPIDFFPWPALRDRLVRHHNYYFATAEFSTHYREHFKFSWPFGFDETYRYNPSTKSYRISPLFERYHRDMRCWSMEEVFFQKFPELVGEMSVHQLDPLDMSSSSTLPADLSPHPHFDFGVDVGNNPCAEDFGNTNCSFADECVMELFNEYPPT